MTAPDLGRRAQAYAARGFAVFPLTPGTKRPMFGSTGHKDATTDPEQVARWWEREPAANIGIAPAASRLMVVDVDAKGDDWQERYQQLRKELDLETRLMVSTPRGGLHLYFSLPPGTIVPSGVNVLAEGVDIRSDGGYVLAPGSIVDGKAYRLPGNRKFHPEAAAMASPRLIRAACRRSEERSENAHEWLVEADQPHNIKLAIKFLSGTTPAIEGRGGDAHTYQTAEIVRDYGISEDLALDLMLEHFNPRCEPPWDAAELRQKVENAYRYANRPAGTKARSPAFEELMEKVYQEHLKREAERQYQQELSEEPRPPKEGRGPVPLSEVVLEDPVEPEWVWDGFILKGKPNFIYGDGGTNKSRLSLQVAIASALGRDCLGVPTTRTAPVFVSCEDDRNELNRRARAMARELGVDFFELDCVQIWDGVGEDFTLAAIDDDGNVRLQAFYGQLLHVVQRAKRDGRHPFVVLDSLYDFFSGNKIAENVARAFVKRVLEKLCEQEGATILVIAHPSQAGMDSGRGYSGSVAWNNAVRARLYVEFDDKQRNYLLNMKKSNYGPADKQLRYIYKDGAVALWDDMDEARKQEQEANIVLSIYTDYVNAGNHLITNVTPFTGGMAADMAKALKRPDDKHLRKYVFDLFKVLAEREKMHYQKAGGNRTAGWHLGPKPQK